MNTEDYKKLIKSNRALKDEFFKEGFQSPIPPEERADFENLHYFEPDLNYRFELELEEFGEKRGLKIEDTGGNMRDFIRWGKFTFKSDNTTCHLYAYKSEAGEDRLFIPFKDETSGNDTYGAGRYLDLYEEGKTGAKWVLDFNLASNPWCAYSENYVCPLIPFENILQVPIYAGEKRYK